MTCVADNDLTPKFFYRLVSHITKPTCSIKQPALQDYFALQKKWSYVTGTTLHYFYMSLQFVTLRLVIFESEIIFKLDDQHITTSEKNK